ncbi:hypothetical protein YTPLAS21_19390 [Candidatus Nitrosocosmicus sp.]|nr:hypothetical protein YTPLAS21_19390 [Candidatus Nitrosocosmicus sp.]
MKDIYDKIIIALFSVFGVMAIVWILKLTLSDLYIQAYSSPEESWYRIAESLEKIEEKLSCE